MREIRGTYPEPEDVDRRWKRTYCKKGGEDLLWLDDSKSEDRSRVDKRTL